MFLKFIVYSFSQSERFPSKKKDKDVEKIKIVKLSKKTSTIIGTPLYMSPEQFRREAYDKKIVEDYIQNLVESDKPHQGFGVRILTYTGYSIELFAFMKNKNGDTELQDPTLAQECESIFQTKTSMKNRFNLRKEFHFNYADLNGFDKGIVFFYYALGLSIDF